jgi:hypothetical protein
MATKIIAYTNVLNVVKKLEPMHLFITIIFTILLNAFRIMADEGITNCLWYFKRQFISIAFSLLLFESSIVL